MSRLGTTTWRKRHYEKLEATKEAAKNIGLNRPVVLDFGPGGLVCFMLGFLPEGKKRHWNKRQLFQRGVLKIFETGLRKTEFFPLMTSEPGEIACLFEELSPEKICVIDIEPKVINAAKKMVKNMKFSIPFEFFIIDIIEKQSPCTGDIVIAYNIVQRTNNFEIALKNIMTSVNKGGLLSINIENASLPGFEQIASDLYLKKSKISG